VNKRVLDREVNVCGVGADRSRSLVSPGHPLEARVRAVGRTLPCSEGTSSWSSGGVSELFLPTAF